MTKRADMMIRRSGGIYADETAICRHYLSDHFGYEGLTDWKEKEFTMIENGRIRIYPACREQMDSFITAEKDDELKKAYCEMLEGCLAHPDQWDWYAMWMIEKTDGTHIGDLCFKGLRENGNPEIGYGVLNEFQGQGYATEAVRLALRWAFGHPEVIAVEAESDPSNAASQRVLKKCGFQTTGEISEERPRFIVYKENNE